MRRVAVPILLLAAVIAAPLGAAEGKIPIWMPTIITQPGYYLLTRDISGSAGPVISIPADGVTLDLNGHTIGQTSMTAPAIDIGGATGGTKGIVIQGGKVQGGLHGIVSSGPGDEMPIVLSDLILSGQMQSAVKAVGFGQLSAQGIIIVNGNVGFELLESAAGQPPPPNPPRAMIRNADIRAGGGIHCTGVICSIRDSSFQYQPADPMAVTPALSFSGVDGGEAVGIVIQGGMPAGSAAPCWIEVVSSSGIIIVGGKIQGPGPVAGGADCIGADATSSDVVIQNTTLTGCAGDGIHALGSDMIIEDGKITGAGGHGIFAGGSNFIIEDGKITANGGSGIWFQTGGHVYRGNVLRGNTGGSVGGPGSTSVVDGGGNIL